MAGGLAGLWWPSYDTPENRAGVASLGAVGIDQNGIPIFRTEAEKQAYMDSNVTNQAWWEVAAYEPSRQAWTTAPTLETFGGPGVGGTADIVPGGGGSPTPTGGGATPIGPPGTGQTFNYTDIFNKWYGGDYGTPGSEAARQAAVLALTAQYQQTMGQDAQTALTMANSLFTDVFEPTVPGGAATTSPDIPPTDTTTPPGTPPPTGGPQDLTGNTTPFGPGLQDTVTTGTSVGDTGLTGTGLLPGETMDQYYARLEGTAAGRGDIYGAGIRSRYAGAANPFQEYLLSQGAPTYNQYTLQNAFGTNPPSSFKSFVSDPNRQWYDPAALLGKVGEWSNVLQNPTNVWSDQIAKVLPFLLDPGNQFNAALQSSLPGIAGFARPYFSNAANNAFSDFSVNNPNTTFLPEFAKKGYRFW